MRKSGMILGAVVALLVTSFAYADGPMAGPAPQAGVVTTTDVKGHALHITISGGINIDGVWRNDNLVAVLERQGPRTAGGGAATDHMTDSDSFWSPRVWLKFDAYMSDHVSACIEIANDRLHSDLISNVKNTHGFLGAGGLTAGTGWGANANSDVFGGGYGANTSILPTIRQAYLQVDDFLFEHFSFRFGMQDFVVDLRGNGEPFLIGFRPDGAGKAFMSPIQESWSVDGDRYAYQAITGAATKGVYKDDEQPGGVRFTYSADEHLHFDAWYFDIWNTGFDNFDEQFYGLMAKYNVPDSPSCGMLIFDIISNDNNRNIVYTIGPGVDYWWDNLEIYGEAYYQWGQYGDDGPGEGRGSTGGLLSPGLAPSAQQSGVIDQEAWASYLGARYNFECSCSPFVDVQWRYLSGSNGDHNDDHDCNENFISYSDTKETMILEDHLYGLGVKTNYWKGQLQTGVKLSLQHEKDLSFGVTYAYAEVVRTPNRLDFPFSSEIAEDGGIGAPIDSFHFNNRLGNEVDVKAAWQYSDSLVFDIGWAGLFDGAFWSERDSRVGFPGGTIGGPDNGSENRNDITDNMWLFTVGATVKF